ncbi:MAG: tetratricopeptide repeat protein [bacterium]
MPEYAVQTNPEPLSHSEQRKVNELLRMATQCRWEHDYEFAEGLLCKALVLDPDFPPCLLELALCLAEGSSRFVSAEKLARRAMHLQPDNPENYFILGKINELGNRSDRAHRYYRQAVRLAPHRNEYKLALDACPRSPGRSAAGRPGRTLGDTVRHKIVKLFGRKI